MPATWLVVLLWTALALAFLSAAAILVDIYGRGHRQQMGIMEAVWPITARCTPARWPSGPTAGTGGR